VFIAESKVIPVPEQRNIRFEKVKRIEKARLIKIRLKNLKFVETIENIYLNISKE